MKPKIVVATATYSTSVEDFRAQLALKTVSTAREAGYAIVVVDGSPDTRFKNALSEVGAMVHAQKGKGMGASRRESMKAGFDAGADIVVWTEPEKYPFIGCISGLAGKMRTDRPHIIVPRRRNLDGYPLYQHFSELRLNHALGNSTGRADLDLSFGPRMFNALAATYFLDYTGEKGDNWETLFIPVLRALHHGVFVESFIINYVHPPEQTAVELGNEDMDRKRDVQRESLVRAMDEEANCLGFVSVLKLTDM